MQASVSHLEAVGLSVAGFTFWVLADSSIKIAGHSGLPAYEVIAFLGIFVVAFLLLHGALRGQVRALLPRKPERQAVRSCLDLANNLCVVVALRHLPLTMFYILVFMAPMVTAVLAALFLRERLGWRQVLAIVIGFAGVVVAVSPWGTSRQGDWIGFAACMVCVACFSANMVWSRVMTQSENPESLTFSSGVVMALWGLGFMLWRAEPLNIKLVLVLLAMGLFCTCGSLCFFKALKHTSAANVSQYHYTQLVSGTLVSYIIWREKPTLPTLAGGALIILSGLYIALMAARTNSNASSLSCAASD